MLKNKFFIIGLVFCSLLAKAQIDANDFVGSYNCTLYQFYGTLIVSPNHIVDIGSASQNDHFLFDDGNTITNSGYYKLNNDSTFYDTLGATGSCKYGNFYEQDSIYYYMCASNGYWSKYYGKKISTGINQNYLKNHLKIYPNPVRLVITIELTGANLWYNQSVVLLKNTLGQVVKTVKLEDMQQQIDVSKLPNGIYFMEVNTLKGVLSKKIVINN